MLFLSMCLFLLSELLCLLNRGRGTATYINLEFLVNGPIYLLKLPLMKH